MGSDCGVPRNLGNLERNKRQDCFRLLRRADATRPGWHPPCDPSAKIHRSWQGTLDPPCALVSHAHETEVFSVFEILSLVSRCARTRTTCEGGQQAEDISGNPCAWLVEKGVTGWTVSRPTAGNNSARVLSCTTHDMERLESHITQLREYRQPRQPVAHSFPWKTIVR